MGAPLDRLVDAYINIACGTNLVRVQSTDTNESDAARTGDDASETNAESSGAPGYSTAHYMLATRATANDEELFQRKISMAPSHQ